MIDYPTIQAALHGWAESATGLSALWAAQDGPRPAYPYLVLNLLPAVRNGINQTSYAFDGGQPQGSEMIPTSSGIRHITWSVQALTSSQAFDESARYYIGILEGKLRFPSALEVFRTAGLSVIGSGTVVDLDQVANNQFISRSSLDITFATVSNGDDAGISYLESTVVSSDLQGLISPDVNLDDESFGG